MHIIMFLLAEEDHRKSVDEADEARIAEGGSSEKDLVHVVFVVALSFFACTRRWRWVSHPPPFR